MYEIATIAFQNTSGFMSIRNEQTGKIYVVPISSRFHMRRKHSGRWPGWGNFIKTRRFLFEDEHGQYK